MKERETKKEKTIKRKKEKKNERNKEDTIHAITYIHTYKAREKYIYIYKCIAIIPVVYHQVDHENLTVHDIFYRIGCTSQYQQLLWVLVEGEVLGLCPLGLFVHDRDK